MFASYKKASRGGMQKKTSMEGSHLGFEVPPDWPGLEEKPLVLTDLDSTFCIPYLKYTTYFSIVKCFFEIFLI